MDNMNMDEVEQLDIDRTYAVNLLDDLDVEDVQKLSTYCKSNYEIDLTSCTEWREEVEKIRKMAAQHKEAKNYPFPNASNVKYPIITSTALQFNARAYPAIINSGNIALVKVIGDDSGRIMMDMNGQPVIDEQGNPVFDVFPGTKKQRANRVSAHMSYQLLEEMDDWEGSMDTMLLTIPIEGTAFKKVYHDDALDRNVSEFVLGTDLVVNDATKSLKDCPRMSHVIPFYPYEIEERVRAGVFDEFDPETENEEPVTFIEQHLRYDLDDDGYPEPIIVTFHEDSGKIVRVVNNFLEENVKERDGEIYHIKPRKYFVKYECFPDPEGKFYSKGLGALLLPLNESVDSILNQLIDAGHLANTGGGFLAKSFRLKSGKVRFEPGEWKKVDVAGMPMKDAIMPLPVPQPSQVLFQLLGVLIDAAKDISSVQDVMTGGGGANTPATTTLAQIEQGMKVYTAIFKRIYRSLKEELGLLYELNRLYLPQSDYEVVLDNGMAVAAEDYENESFDIRPAADPSMATNVQKTLRDQFLAQFVNDPRVDGQKILIELFTNMGINNPEDYLAKQTGPSPEQIVEMQDMELKASEQDRKNRETDAKIMETIASALEKVAKTDEMGANNPLNATELATIQTLLEEKYADQGTMDGLEGEQ